MNLSNTLVVQMEEIELSYIEQLKNNCVINGISKLSSDQFNEILLQRRFLSLAITNLYDLAIDSTTGKDCKLVLRRIQREEYPDPTSSEQFPPSHREDLVCDLQQLGITLQQILQSRPSKSTTFCIHSMINKMLVYGSERSAIKTIAFIRFAGEVLVSEEYKCLWTRISKILESSGRNPKLSSRFFWPHIIHDARCSFSSDMRRSKTHSSYLGVILSRMINNDFDLAMFKTAERDALRLKCFFYNQFASSVN
jgi:hypothetical protein